MVLPTELLRKAMDRTREGGGSALAALQFAIGTAEAAEGVDGAMLQEAKTLLATQPLQTAMAQRDVATLRTAIEVAEGNADVDRAVVEVSGCAAYGLARYTQYTPHAIMAHTHPLLHPITFVGGEGAAASAAHGAASGSDGQAEARTAQNQDHDRGGDW